MRRMPIARDPDRTRWLLLMHQLPAQPAYLRVKVGRRLTGVGAVPLKNSVYALPTSDAAHEDFQWIRREIVDGGGDATLVEALMVEGMSDAEVEQRFRDSKDAEYMQVTSQVRLLRAAHRKKRRLTENERAELLTKIGRMQQRVEEIARTDFYSAPGREVATGLLNELLSQVSAISPGQARKLEATQNAPAPHGRVWVTRTGIHVDRIASAWLISRFIDPAASFKFVPAKGYVRSDGELSYDMFDADYSHEGEHCTFETLCQRFDLRTTGLRELSEVIHDIDLKETKFARSETAGFAACLNGMCRNTREDEERLRHGVVLLEALLTHYSKRKELQR